jgi:hypothetical protein
MAHSFRVKRVLNRWISELDLIYPECISWTRQLPGKMHRSLFGRLGQSNQYTGTDMNSSLKKVISIFSLSVALLPNIVCADTTEDWEFGLSIYGWFPDISGTTSFPTGGGGDFTVPIGDILDNLSFTFQGSFDARKGHWGMFTDVVYMDLGKKKSLLNEGSIGGNDWPVDITAKVGFDMKSWIVTAAGYYRLVDQPKHTFDMVAGLRYMDVSQSLDWSINGNVGEIPLPERDGGSKVGATYWDAIVGMRGRLALGQNNTWYMPYYLDIGTGDSDFTWQAVGGIGYAFKWGELAAVYRYLSYDLPSSTPIADMDFSGPEIGAVFRW